MPDTHTSALLDVENDDDRERRIGRLLRKTDSKGTASSEPRTGSSSNFDFGVHDNAHEGDPPTQLLQRLQAFLPQMEASNAALLQRAQQNPESVDIEHLEHPEGQYIEMNLGLGVFTMRQRTADGSTPTDSDSEQDPDSNDDSASSSGSDSDSDSDSSSSSDNSSSRPGHHGSSDALGTRRPMRPLPNRARPSIVVLGDPDTTHEREQSA